MKQLIDLAQWPRREHFAFFSSFDEPFFGLTANVDCTQAYVEAKRQGVPFFLYYLYHSLQAAQEVEEFRYRIEGEQVVCYDRVHASATIGRPDHTFGFSFIEQQASLADFVAGAQAEIAAVQAVGGLNLTERTGRPDLPLNALKNPIEFGTCTRIGNGLHECPHRSEIASQYCRVLVHGT